MGDMCLCSNMLFICGWGEFTDLLGESLGGIWDTVWETHSSGRSLLGS